ncbi:MAG: LPS export ABC transporter periplasmic protein LptC [Alphaproteobacteria bacterium]
MTGDVVSPDTGTDRATGNGGIEAGVRRGRLGGLPVPGRPAAARFRRSRLVALLKVALPGAAIAILVIIAAWPYIVPDLERLRLELPVVGPAGGARPQVLNPRLLGLDEQRRPYQITADSGTQVDSNDGRELYALTQPKYDITLLDGSWLALTAQSGLYEKEAQVLWLSGEVSLFHDEGAEFVTTSARIDLTDNTAAGDAPVQGQGPAGVLTSEGFRVIDGGERVLFTGRARMTVTAGGG